jgi:hypothetical protein
MDFGTSNHMTSHGEWLRDTKDLKKPRFVKTGDDTTHPITRWANKVFERCTSGSKHNKKIGLRRPDGGRFTSDIQPKWMFYGRHEELKQIDCKKGKEWTIVHLGCEHA